MKKLLGANLHEHDKIRFLAGEIAARYDLARLMPYNFNIGCICVNDSNENKFDENFGHFLNIIIDY